MQVQAASLRVPLRPAVDKVRRGPGVCPKRPHCEEVAAVVARRHGGVRGAEVARAYLHRGPTSTACAGGEMHAGQAQVAADTFAQGFGPASDGGHCAVGPRPHGTVAAELHRNGVGSAGSSNGSK